MTKQDRRDWCDDRFYSSAALLEWSSITKTVTARLLVELERAGLVDADAPVSSMLPLLELGGATLRDLSLHRAGLPVMHPGAGIGLAGDPCQGAHGAEFLTGQADKLAAASRGRVGTYRYSNLGYATLGLSLEAATGRTWFDLVREWVLPPAQFSSVAVAPETRRRALPRVLGFRREPWSMSDGIYQAAGGLWSTFDDMVLYAQDALRSGHRAGWFVLREGVYFHTGQARDTGACIVIDAHRQRVGVAHAMLRSPAVPKRMLEALMFDAQR